MRKFILGCSLLCASVQVLAADCRADIAASAPTERFVVTSETVADRDTTLMWTRCALGQKWDGKSCAGAPNLSSWKEAMEQAAILNREGFAGHHDWRLPMVPELASIVERRCFNPRVNEDIFPGAPSQLFWSSMEKRGMSGWAYTLDFGAGAAEATSEATLGAVRLVRGGPWWQPPKEMAAR